MNVKQLAAEKATEYIQNGMVVGLGTGSTAYWAIKKIGEKVKHGLNITAVASSYESEKLAGESGITIVSFSSIDSIDLTIDGADEVDAHYNLIKGGGGALLREKILASNSKRFIVVVDESKLVEVLGKFPLPVEIIPFAPGFTLKHLKELGCAPEIRKKDGKEYITDNGNFIADCHFGSIPDPAQMNLQIRAIPGVIETGLFVNSMVTFVVAGFANQTVVEYKKEVNTP